MKIPAGYMDRRREGDTVLRQTQLVLLHLLHVIDRICSENGIRYWLAWGSCLGAMRHDGFIPWDDDLDIGLSVKDFKRLIKLAAGIAGGCAAAGSGGLSQGGDSISKGAGLQFVSV